MATSVVVTVGDLLDQNVEAIVNPWNCNLVPWWLLLPHGVAGAIRKRAGSRPFRELARAGLLRPGSAAVTSAGRLNFRGVIHVAGLNVFWCSSEAIVRDCVRNALAVASSRSYASVALPLIGSGVGGLHPDRVERIIVDEARLSDFTGSVVVVRRVSGVACV